MADPQTQTQECAAWYSRPPHHLHSYQCERPAKVVVGGVPCCGTHARIARRWEEQGSLATMAAHWWRWERGSDA